MTNIYMLLLMSVSGTIMYLLSSIFGKKTRHHIWHYAMLITSVIMLLVPIQKIFEIPRLFNVTVPDTLNIGNAGTAQAASQMPVSSADIITAVWIIGIVVFAARIIFKYIKTLLTLRQITEKCYNSKVLDVYFNVCKKLSIRRNIELCSSKYLNSPLLFGIFRPTIIIPEKSFSESELEMILTHELTHYKHKDLWIALAASIAQCVHWFNPAVYFIGKSISEVCELFCDETVVKSLDKENKKAYGNLILSVIEREFHSRLAYTTSMASAKGSIQKRLRKIVEFKMPTKASTIAGIMAVCAFSVSSLTAFGFETAAEVIPEEVKQIIPIAVPTAKPYGETSAVLPTEVPYDASKKPSKKSSAAPLTKAPYDTSDSVPLAAIPYKYDEVSDMSYEQIQEISDKNDEGAISDKGDEGAVSDETESKQWTLIDISKGAVSFSANFTEKGQEMKSAHTFTSDTDTTVAVYASSGKISVVNADTNEVVYDGSDSEEKTAYIPMSGGERWNISVISEDDGESKANVFTYGYSDDTNN